MEKADRDRLNECGATSLEPVKDESEHFYTCPICGQSVDMRRLGDVFHHDEEQHEPIPTN